MNAPGKTLANKSWLAAILILGLAASGCQPPAGTPQPTVWAVRVQYSAALEPAVKNLSACAEKQPGIGLITHQLPASQLDPSKADLTLLLGSPAGFSGFSAQIGTDDLVVIVNPSNPAEVQPKDIPGIFSGQTRSWDELSARQAQGLATRQPAPVHAWRYYAGEDVETALEKIFPAGQGFSDRLPQAPGPKEMVEAVAGDPDAIGFIPRSFATPDIRILQMENPGLQGIPQLALSPTEPQGPARSLLACLQARP